MICAGLVSSLFVPVGIRYADVPIPDAQAVVVQAWIKTGRLNRREGAAMSVLKSVLLDGTAQFTAQKFLLYASQAGVAPSITVGDGFVRIQIVAPKTGLTVAAGLLESLIQSPSLDPESIERAKSAGWNLGRDWWDRTLEPFTYDVRGVTPSDVSLTYHRIFRPENILIIAGGAVKAGDTEKEFQVRFSQWTFRNAAPGIPAADPQPIVSHGGDFMTLSFVAKPLARWEKNSAAKVLATFAIGVGKTSTLFRSIREKKLQSYFQGAVIWPNLSGLTPKFVIATRNQTDFVNLWDGVRKDIQDDIENWSEVSKERALRLAESSLLFGIEPNPFWLNSRTQIGGDLSSRVTLSAYGQFVGQPNLSVDALLHDLAGVTLEEMRAAAKSILDEVQVSVIPGK